MLFEPIKPMLLQFGKELIDDKSLLGDIKFDGWRIILHKKFDYLEAFTRHGTRVTDKFPELEAAGRSIKCDSAILDCEGVVLREGGRSDFESFSHRGLLSNKEKIKEATKTHPVSFIAFDVLSTDDQMHLDKPLIERRKLLTKIIEPSNELLITPFIQGNISKIFELTKEKQMEGIVTKRIDSTYRLNYRSADWLKYKHFKILPNAIIMGYKENPFSLIVGSRLENGKMKVLANVEFGFKGYEKVIFRDIASKMIIKEERGVKWLDPILSCAVQYLEKTEKGLLRTVSFKGFNFET